ncbi:porin [Aeromonas media]|uniref:oligogalacturonate-specific porin KdgM family protein n=1 Tax=Aeromonas media TaxID=651 RepID=UPI00148B23EA|nr:oligogalacturonate-specific porin KdgM family protein [Aeromonas media]QJT24983.1 porin [Aeromonas media]
MNRNLLFVTAMLASFSSQATYIDYRHEWLSDEKKQEDRIKMGHQMDNGLYYSIEGKWESKHGDFLQNLTSKGNEFEIGYKMKPFDDQNFTLQPSFALDSGEGDSAYKFSLKGSYKWTDKFNTGLRLRYAVRDYEQEVSAPKDSTHYWQSNLYLGYKVGDFAFTYDFEYKFDTDYPALKGEEYDYLHNLNVSWTGNKTWVPYIEVGYVNYNDGSYFVNGASQKNAWQMRYRVGIAYNF